jgi:hypothetical protein
VIHISEGLPTRIAMNAQANHQLVPAFCLGKPDGTTFLVLHVVCRTTFPRVFELTNRVRSFCETQRHLSPDIIRLRMKKVLIDFRNKELIFIFLGLVIGFVLANPCIERSDIEYGVCDFFILLLLPSGSLGHLAFGLF